MDMYEWLVKGEKKGENHCKTYIFLKIVYENTMNECK